MSRPKRKRFLTNPPLMEGFKPFGVPVTRIEPVVLFFEEYESLRLLDYLGMTQLEAANEMAVSRPTLTRIYEKARRTIAEAFVEGKAVFIEGGDFNTNEYWYRCEACHKLLISDEAILSCSYCKSNKIRLLSNKPTKTDLLQHEDGTGFCICMNCNSKIPHQTGIPCRECICPRCGKNMIRENSYHHKLYLNKKGKK